MIGPDPRADFGLDPSRGGGRSFSADARTYKGSAVVMSAIGFEASFFSSNFDFALSCRSEVG
jgi:hypothetical protein